MYPSRIHLSLSTTAFLILMLAAFTGLAAAPSISQSELLELVESGSGPLILDVRSPAEFRAGHIPRAINIPHKALAGRLGELAIAKNREIVTYCEMGPRARIAESILQNAGYSRVRHLQGDMNLWRSNGLPIANP